MYMCIYIYIHIHYMCMCMYIYIYIYTLAARPWSALRRSRRPGNSYYYRYCYY